MDNGNRGLSSLALILNACSETRSKLMIIGGPRKRIWNKFAEGDFLTISTFQLLFFTRKCPNLGYRYCPPKALIMEQMEIKRTHGSSPDGDFETSESERSHSSSGASPSRRGKYCCAKELFYDLNGNLTGISLFKFPLNSRKKRFLTFIKRQQNNRIVEYLRAISG